LSVGREAWPDAAALRAHMERIGAFYASHAIDPAGGFFQYFIDDGQAVERGTRHLVGSARMTVNWARSAVVFDSDADRQRAAHGLAFLSQAHRLGQAGAYAWRLCDGRVADDTQHAYGHAFVLLAHAHAALAGVPGAQQGLARVFDEQTRCYWDPQQGLLTDRWDAGFRACSAYRGQNSNMHACEALLAAWQASGERACLERAAIIAERVTGDLAAQGGGVVWEHYDAHWRIDWDHHRDRPADRYQPWGFQPGHHAEWARLLLCLHREQPDPRWPQRAARLFDWALEHGWDAEHGGLVYSVAPDGRVHNADKVAWVQAEALAAAVLLAEHTGQAVYAAWAARLWQHIAAHFVHPRHGTWRRWLDAQHRRPADAPAADNPTDYHALAACHEWLTVLEGKATAAPR
jgi:mannose/cellobiose epimerase-like protein (N-acyl-D-glucosamine 2-epimerase family)